MRRSRFEVYRREDGAFDWRLVAANGRIVGTSGGQGYRTAYEARRGVTALLAACGAADVEVLP